MKQIGENIEKRHAQLLQTPTKKVNYTLVIHDLCEKYGITRAVDKLVFSTVESMSRGRICIYKPVQIARYAGGTEQEVMSALLVLEEKRVIEGAYLDHTQGWRLTPEARRNADAMKQLIRVSGKSSKTRN